MIYKVEMMQLDALVLFWYFFAYLATHSRSYFSNCEIYLIL